MPANIDPDTLKIPAFLRKKAIVSQARQKLILTALDRKEAGLSPHSQKALATPKTHLRSTARTAVPSKPVRSYKPTKPAFGRPAAGLRFAKTSRLGRNLFQQTSFEQPMHEAPLPGISTSGRKAAAPRQTVTPPSTLSKKTFPCIGEITHYLDRIGVAIIMLSAPLKENETVLIQGEDFLFLQTVNEMQIERKPVAKARKGAHIGLKTDRPAKVNGKIYRCGY
jgi:hypothetical protein